MAWFKTGGGNEIDLSSAPNAIYQNTSMNNNATASLSVTQKPRLIVIGFSATNIAGNHLIGLYDVQKDSAWCYGYWSSNSQSNKFTNIHDYITSVSDSAVNIKNVWGYPIRIEVAAYY